VNPKTQLELLVLSTLARGPGHGYALIERLRERSGGAVDYPEGTIYPALHRLERRGLLASEWTEGPARRRRVYSLTKAGRTALERQVREWRELVRLVDGVVGEAA
jgi:DNA-binding PadR family transcriptional regulator